ncbi:thermonuclease family protein [Xanthobacter sediminis]
MSQPVSKASPGGAGATASSGAATAFASHRSTRRPAGRIVAGALGLLAAVLPDGGAALAAAAGDARAAAACTPAEGPSDAPARVAGVGPDGSLMLEDGRRFVPDHIVLPTRLEPALSDAAARAVLEALGGRRLALSRTASDRHGRLTGEARLTDAAGGQADLAAALVAAGAAYADGEGPCAPALLAAEADARRARRGLWAQKGAVADAGDEGEMGRRRGLYAVAEGRVVAVGVRRERTYLNFGETWRRDFTVIIPTADFAIMFGQGGAEDQGPGHDPATLRGARVRVRGVVREQGGPAIMARSAADIVRLADRRGSED